MRTRFFRALTGTCAGTGIFAELRTQSLWRTLWHLLLTTVLTVLVMSVGVCSRLSGIGRAIAEQFEEQCGGIRISAAGLVPAQDVEKPRSFLLPGMFQVNYIPENQELPANFPGHAVRGVLWLPGRLGVWTKSRGGAYLLSAVTTQTARLGEMREFGAPGELLAELRRQPALPWGQLGDEEQVLNSSRLQALWNFFLLVGLPIALFVETLFQVLLYVAMFALVFWLMSLHRPNRRQLREVIVLAVYAGFPAMLVGALATALDLPFFDFNWIYVLGMTGYLMVVMNRLEHDRRDHAQDAGQK